MFGNFQEFKEGFLDQFPILGILHSGKRKNAPYLSFVREEV